jgi:rod shape-determining protein MreD
MNWLSFSILAYLMLGIQLALADTLRWGGASPDLLLILVVFVAINASRDAGLLGCLILGFVHDLAGGGAIGLHALGYGLSALVLVAAQPLIYRDNPLSHFFLTLLAGFLVQGLFWIHGLIRPPVAILGQGETAARVGLAVLCWAAIYTSLISVPVLMGLVKLKALLSFQPARKRLRV